MAMKQKVKKFIGEWWKDVYSTVWLMFKIMIPVSIVVKILKEVGAIEWIGELLAPVMQWVGLPGEMGLVWATGMITNLFGGLLAFFQISEGMNLSIEQVSVISVMMLVAHTFPIELEIARKAGVRIWFSFLWRFLFAFVLGWLIHMVYSRIPMFSATATVSWRPEAAPDPSLADWALGELKSYAIILAFIVSLILVVKLMKEFGLIRLIQKALAPLFRLLGIGENATTVTIIGLTLGIVYGGALIINESGTREIRRRDVFYSLAFMGLCHSVIEDTLLVVAIGADWIAVLLIRLVFALLLTAVLVRLMNRLSDRNFMRFMMTRSALQNGVTKDKTQ